MTRSSNENKPEIQYYYLKLDKKYPEIDLTIIGIFKNINVDCEFRIVPHTDDYSGENIEEMQKWGIYMKTEKAALKKIENILQEGNIVCDIIEIIDTKSFEKKSQIFWSGIN